MVISTNTHLNTMPTMEYFFVLATLLVYYFQIESPFDHVMNKIFFLENKIFFLKY